VPVHLALGEGYLKKTKGASPSAWAWALGEEVLKKKEFLPRVLHSGKRFQNKKKEISSPSVALGEE
jgi:hypothetical protein